MKSNTVLVTGGAGFIGSHLVKRLVSLGAEVTVTVKYNSIIDNVRLSSLWNQLEIVEADMRNIDSLRQLRGRGFDAIFHLAAYNHVGDSFLHISEALSSNALATANLFESGVEFERFVYVSSSEVYGLQDSVPFVESAQPFPLSPYSIGKYAGELYSQLKRHQGGQPIACVRPFNTFGPYQSERAIIPELIVKCLRGVDIETTEGKQTREFNFVENQVDGLLAVATCESMPTEVINIGCGEEVAICDLVTKIHSLCESSSQLKIGALPTRPNEIWNMCCDASRARDLLGWKPQLSLEQGLRRTVEWFRHYCHLYYQSDSPLNQL